LDEKIETEISKGEDDEMNADLRILEYVRTVLLDFPDSLENLDLKTLDVVRTYLLG
jgi:hypothetical protein